MNFSGESPKEFFSIIGDFVDKRIFGFFKKRNVVMTSPATVVKVRAKGDVLIRLAESSEESGEDFVVKNESGDLIKDGDSVWVEHWNDYSNARIIGKKGSHTSHIKINEPEKDGVSGQVLATDGDGNRYWKTVSGGGGGGGSDGSGGTSDYDQLSNRPQLNGVTLSGNVTGSQVGLAAENHNHTRASIVDFPNDVSAFYNDAGYITQHQSLSDYRTSAAQDAIDATKITEPEHEGTDGQVLATDGSGHRYWKTASGGGGGGTDDYEQLSNRPKINSNLLVGDKTSTDLGLADENHIHMIEDIMDFPTDVSSFKNDAGYLTEHQSLSDYRTASEQDSIDDNKQDVISDLDYIRDGAAAGYAAYVLPDSGIPEEDLKSTVRASLALADTALQSFTEEDPVFSASAAYGITSSNISDWNAKGSYSKPSNGIPKSDLEQSVQTSLDKADSALQSFTEEDPVFVASVAHDITSSDISNWNAKGTYNKPSDGIPKTDLESSVQSSLSLADSALQSYTETDPIFAASAAYGISSSDISAWNAKGTYSKPSGGIPEEDLANALQTKIDNAIQEPSSDGTEGQVLATDGNGTRYWKTVSGSSGTTDYDELSNRPQINSNTLTGNKSASDLGLAAESHTHAKSDISDFPTNISSFTNDAGYLTSHQSLSAYRTSADQDAIDSGKQDAISDLADIRSGAGKGDTAVQPEDLASVATSGSYNDLTNTPTIPSEVTESTVSGWGFTKNTGTYSKPSTGIPNTDLEESYSLIDHNHDGVYLKSFTESDPVFTASAAYGITSGDISSWDSKGTYSKPSGGIPASDLAESYSLASHSHTPSEIHALPDTTVIPTVPTSLSSFADDLGSSPTHTHSQYLTEHQSLDDYVTKNTAQTITAAKTFQGNIQMSGGKIILDSGSYGTSLPSTGEVGQLFFLKA